jgi:hypothetical protein
MLVVIAGWLGAVSVWRPEPADPSPAPVGSVVFESPLYGYRIEIPEDWTVSPANIEWRWAESLNEGSWPPYSRDDALWADERGLYISAMAIPLDMSEAGWLDHMQGVITGSCPELPVVRSLRVDGADGRLVESCYGPMVLTAASGRGYKVWGDDESLRSILETIRLASEPPADRPASADAWRGIWPQDTFEAAESAQAGANAGDPDDAWQTSSQQGSHEAEPVEARFVEEQLGWGEYRSLGGSTGCSSDDDRSSRTCVHESYVLHCEPGLDNPAYPTDACAPSDGNRFEAALVRIEQLVDAGRNGIWIVTRSEALPPFEQAVPPAEDEVRAAVSAFADARIAGEGAERYLPEGFGQVQLLYETSGGEPYEGFEIVDQSSPSWPSGEVTVTLRMLASGGDVVVEQMLAVLQRSPDHPLLPDGLWFEGRDVATENGVPVAVRYGILGGRVTFAAREPWFSPWFGGIVEGDESILVQDGAYFVVLSDPWLPQPGCAGVPATAGELIDGILGDPELQAGEPVSATVRGVDAAWVDVSRALSAEVCGRGDTPPSGGVPVTGVPVVVAHGSSGNPHAFAVRSDTRMRIYLLELPGEPPETIAIMLIAPTDTFEDALAASEPIIDSIRFEEG